MQCIIMHLHNHVLQFSSLFVLLKAKIVDRIFVNYFTDLKCLLMCLYKQLLFMGQNLSIYSAHLRVLSKYQINSINIVFQIQNKSYRLGENTRCILRMCFK